MIDKQYYTFKTILNQLNDKYHKIYTHSIKDTYKNVINNTYTYNKINSFNYSFNSNTRIIGPYFKIIDNEGISSHIRLAKFSHSDTNSMYDALSKIKQSLEIK